MDTITLNDIRVGSFVAVTDWINGKTTATVTNVEPDIKDGKPGVDLSNGTWKYLDQIDYVISF